jgi:hypothetical protein
MHPNPSTELALRAFEADAAFNAALARFQKDPPEGTIIAEARRAAGHGFSWFCCPSEPGFFEVRLRHSGGAEISAEGKSIAALLAGLLGHHLAHDVAIVAAQAAEPEQDESDLSPATKSALAEADAAIDAVEAAANAQLLRHQLLANLSAYHAQSAAESLAAATGGAVVEEEPDDAERLRLAAPLTADQKAVCVAMITSLSPEARKTFTIAFRDAFRVPREARTIAPLITEVRHMEFCDRWSIEAAGGVAA